MVSSKVWLGAGLVLEGGIRKYIKRGLGKGLSDNDVVHLLAIVIGLFAIFVGLFSLPEVGQLPERLIGLKGIIAFVAVIIIILETWFVK